MDAELQRRGARTRKHQNTIDFAVRMPQFFDRYLKDAQTPVWLAQGIPAIEKGKALSRWQIREEGGYSNALI